MKKNLLLGMCAALGMVLVASCNQDELNPTSDGNEAVVSFTIDVENGVQTRAISDGTSVNKLFYALFNGNGVRVEGMAKDSIETSFPATVSLTLAKNQEYEVVFWAQNKDCKAYKIDDDMNVTVSYDEATNNDETRDAFYGTSGKFTISGSGSKSVTLTRPFAQINVGVTQDDWTAASNLGIDIEKSSVVIANAGKQINLLTGEVSGTAEEVTYALADIPAIAEDEEVLTVGDTEYKWLSMSYILVDEQTSSNGADKTTLESLSYTFQPKSGTEITFSNGLTSVPVQRNYRTNILGQILTGDLQFEIVIDKNYSGDQSVEEWDGSMSEPTLNGTTYSVSTAAELAWIANQVNTQSSTFENYTVELTDDIYLNNQAWTPIGNVQSYPSITFAGTFEGNDHTIYNLNASSSEAAGLFGSITGVIQNVTVDGATVTGNHWAGVICGYSSTNVGMSISNCHVKNATVTVTVEEVDGEWDNGDKAGGIIGYMVAGDTVTGCSVENTTITAYRDLGGIVGYANGTSSSAVIVTNNTVGDNVVLIVDATTAHNYKDYAITGHYADSIIGNPVNQVTSTDNSGTATIEYIVDETSILTALSTDSVTSVVVSEDTDISGEATIEVSGTKTIEIEEGATLYVSDEFLSIVDGGTVTITGGGTLTNASQEATTSSVAIRTKSSDTSTSEPRRVIDVKNGTLYLDGVTVVNDTTWHWHSTTDSSEKSAAITYWGNSTITIKNSTIKSGMFTLCGMDTTNTTQIANTSTVILENSRFESNSSANKNVSGTTQYAYAIRLFGSKVTMTDCVVKGVQGGIAVEECQDFTINSGKYYTVDTDGYTDAFYAMHISDYAVITVLGGEFSGPNRRHTYIEEGTTSAVVSGDNDKGKSPGSFILKGGKYSGKPYNYVTGDVYDPEDGYEYKEITDDTSGLSLNWEIVASETAEE